MERHSAGFEGEYALVNIIQAVMTNHVNQTHALFTEYADSLGIDLGFQNFEAELENLPGEYRGSAGGLLLLALDYEQPVGCVGLRKIDDGTCEMKRLYVRPPWTGQGIGKRLAITIIKEAKKFGYRFMRLDTLPTMGPAISLYKSLGFYTIAPYRFNPIPGAIYLEMDLRN